MKSDLAPIVKLDGGHDTNAFDCDDEALNRFINRHALVNQRSQACQTYVACRGKTVIGYYSLAVGSVGIEESPERVRKGLARHPIPVMLLARLAVDKNEQGAGIGRGLLKDALLRTLQAADIAGIRAILVHAKDERARRWYEQFDFEPSPTDPLHLFLMVKDARLLVS